MAVTHGRSDETFGPNSPGMSHVVHRNIRSLVDVRRMEEASRSTSDRIADAIASFAGSMWCVYAHLALFGGWLIFNSTEGLPHWDPYPFVMLAVMASVEAIFLSTFILITQNRSQRIADRRAELDLQVSLLAEHELTQALRLIDAIAKKLDVPRDPAEDLEDTKRDVAPEKVVREIERAQSELKDHS